MLRIDSELARRRQRRELRIAKPELPRAGVGATGIREDRLNARSVTTRRQECRRPELSAAAGRSSVGAATFLSPRGDGPRIQAILANSGCANACTGKTGLRDAELSALATAGELGISPKHVLVASTGVIGRPLPMDRLLAGMKAAAKKLGSTPAHGLAAEKAVMTTDTKPKQACATVTIGGKTVTVGGMSKGSGMIEPNMATMLGFITTDAAMYDSPEAQHHQRCAHRRQA